jgi:CRISPR/Cas system CSM-associated protein Csm3 (group 7 of RAMP superfamily)
VPFPRQKPQLKHPVGHDRYRNDRLHGKLVLKLTVKTAVHISTGIVAMGTDLGNRIPLIKTMAQSRQQKLTIPGSSLKGVVRSAFEAITNNTKIKCRRIVCPVAKKNCSAQPVWFLERWTGRG